MNSSLLFCIIFCTCISLILADCDNLQDICPTDTSRKNTIFINGFPCKNPATAKAEDFKSTKLNRSGDTDNFLHSAVTIATAADYPGLNTLGLSIARTDLDVDGVVAPHSHPRASEIFFVNAGVVIAGFIDTRNNVFQETLNAGDVFVFPRGLLHFCLNGGFDAAVAFSVLNSQNPGVVKISDAMFDSDHPVLDNLIRKIKSFSALELQGIGNATFSDL